MGKEKNKTRGKSGKFFLERIEAGIASSPEKWQKYHRSKRFNNSSRKGRRNYPWRKKT